jgi:hypothetical protein
MGVDVDLNPGDPIVAPGTSRVVGIMPNWYQGQPYVALQLLDGPMKGHNYYVAEQIDPAVTVGQVVQQGQPIAHYASSGTGIEMGWAGSNWEQTLAQAEGNTGDPSHNDAPAGVSFRSFLDSLPRPGAAHPVSPEVAAAPAGTPTPAGDGAGSSPAGGPGPQQPVSPAEVPAAAPPPPPGTASFKAVEHGHRGFHRHTVQFLEAVQPTPGSPLYGQGPAGGQPEQVVQAPGGAAEQNQMVGQGPGVVPEPTGGSISVQS